MEKQTGTQSMIVLSNRQKLSLTGVKKVKEANQTSAILEIGDSTLIVGGNNMEIQKLDLENGQLDIVGQIDCLKFAVPKENFFKRIFK